MRRKMRLNFKQAGGLVMCGLLLSACSGVADKPKVSGAKSKSSSFERHLSKEYKKLVAYEKKASKKNPVSRTKNFVAFFDYGSAKLSKPAQMAVESAVGFALNKNSSSIAVTGHTDTVGSRKANKALAKKRVAAVLANFKVAGFNLKKDIVDVALGELDPTVLSGDGKKEKLNRRVVVAVDYNLTDPNIKYFAKRAKMAAKGKAPGPQMISERRLKSKYAKALGPSYARLWSALDGKGAKLDGKNAAKAQVNYECWLRQAELNKKKNKKLGKCKSSFYGAMAMLEGAIYNAKKKKKK